MIGGAARGARWIGPAALVIALFSLAGNLYLLAQLRQPERWAAPAIRRAAGGLASEDATIRYQIRLPAGTPIRFDLPVDEKFSVRVDTQIPINTRVQLPIRSPLGNYQVSVPVRANIPLRTSVPLRIQHTFRVRTRTGAEINVPLELRVRDLPLDDLLRSLEAPAR